MKQRWWLRSLVVSALALTISGCGGGDKTVFLDADGDGFGTASVATKISGDTPPLFSEDNTDCNDSAVEANPNGTETCDGLDNDCDGTADNVSGTTCPTVGVPSAFDLVNAGGHHTYNVDQYQAHTCAISDGTLWCTGSNGRGQLGTGDFVSRSEFTQVGSSSDWLAVAAHGSGTCGIRGSGSEGTLWCWGSNKENGKMGYDPVGLLGLGASFDTVANVTSPTQVGTATNWTSVSLGTNHGCGLNSSNELWCWGANAEGPLGNNSTTDSSDPVQEDGAFTDWAAVSTGERANTCGIRDDGAGSRTLWCWGHGMDSVGSSSNAVPTQIGAATTWATISVGPESACGIQESSGDRTLWCGGNNQHGQLGDGNGNTSSDFAQIGVSTTWQSVDAGIGFACGINNGDLYCWGRNYGYAHLGLGGDLSLYGSCVLDLNNDEAWDCPVPEKVNGTETWASVSTGNRQSCATTSSGKVWCWGYNTSGEAGVTDDAYLLEPVQIN